MGTFKLILYPFGMAIVALVVVTFVGMAMFGAPFTEWAPWQSELVNTFGTIAGFIAIITGLRLAVRSERQAID